MFAFPFTRYQVYEQECGFLLKSGPRLEGRVNIVARGHVTTPGIGIHGALPRRYVHAIPLHSLPKLKYVCRCVSLRSEAEALLVGVVEDMILSCLGPV